MDGEPLEPGTGYWSYRPTTLDQFMSILISDKHSPAMCYLQVLAVSRKYLLITCLWVLCICLFSLIATSSEATVRVPFKSGWPSGLRRQLQVLVRKGVGSNPTSDIGSIAACDQNFFSLHIAEHLHPTISVTIKIFLFISFDLFSTFEQVSTTQCSAPDSNNMGYAAQAKHKATQFSTSQLGTAQRSMLHGAVCELLCTRIHLGVACSVSSICNVQNALTLPM